MHNPSYQLSGLAVVAGRSSRCYPDSREEINAGEGTLCAMNSSSSPPKLIQMPEVLARTGLSRTTLFRFRRAGVFPEAVRVGANKVAWREAEVVAWMDGLPPASVESATP